MIEEMVSGKELLDSYLKSYNNYVKGKENYTYQESINRRETKVWLKILLSDC